MPEPVPAIPPWTDGVVDVDEFIETNGPLESGGPSWTITDDNAAEWAMAHVAAAETQMGAVRDQYLLWLDQLTRWSEDATKGPKRTVAFFTAHLQRYAVAARERDPKRKTLTLPSGAAPTTEHKPSVIIVNDAALIEWAERTLLPDVDDPANVPDGEPVTYADAGVVKVTKEARISELRRLVRIHETVCEECAGDGSVTGIELSDGSETIETCGVCDGERVTRSVITLGYGELVPGVAVDPGGITANTLKPVKAVTL